MNTKTTQSRLARLRHRIKHERGAVLVEAAICIPLLLVVILGAVEAGTAWEAKSSTVSGVRTGVLRASTIGDRPETDMRIIQSVVGEIGAENVAGLDWIMVFEAEGDSEAKYNTCLGGSDVSPAGGTGCVVYNNGFITNVANATDAVTFQETNFDTGIGGTFDPITGATLTYTCDTTKVDRNWCAGQRTVGGDTQIGVAIRYNHEWMTGIFPVDAPVFQEYVISSTFADGGSDITPSAPVATPFRSGTIIDTDFGAGFDSTGFGGTDAINTVTSPNGEEFLGRYSTDTITLTLDDLPEGYEVCVSFDLYIVGTWDNGSDDRWGPDTFQATIDGVGDAPATYSRPSTDDLGYGNSGTIPMYVCSIVPTGGEVTVSFIGEMIEHRSPEMDIDNESWGIDNLIVTTAP